MSEHNHHITYTAADIQRYLQGQLAPAEMHAMEKAALDDPFLADAIEGMQEAMQQHGQPLVTGQLDELHHQFQNRTTKSRVVAFRWWQAAAAAVIIIAGGLWIYNFSSTKETLTVAQQEKAPMAPANNENDASVATDSAPAASVQPPQQTASANTRQDQKAVKPAPSVQEAAPPVADLSDTSHAVADARINKPIQKDLLKEEAKRPRQAFSQNQTESVAVSQPATAIIKKENDFSNRGTELITIAKNDSQVKQVLSIDKNLSGVVKGRVTDPYHNPVANAYITLPNNANYNMLTDKTGYFRLPATDSVVDVAVNVVGYGTQNFRLQNNASLNEVQLQPANAPLDEVVVIGYGSKAKRSKTQARYPEVMVQDAEPVYGWLAYEQYLDKNKQIPANYKQMTGNVAVSFLVNKKGSLSDFKIEQSLAKPYDDEAIRLISQGPAWKLIKGRKAKITVIVKF